LHQVESVLNVTGAKLSIRSVEGAKIQEYVGELASLRMTGFSEYPYLYDGDLEYERRYLQTYVDAPECIVVLALDGDRVVGASTAIPLAAYSREMQAPLLEGGLDIQTLFYIGEVILLAPYRGQGFGVRFFEEMEAYARRLNRFETAVLCTVERPPDHPRRPTGYRDLDGFWNRLGYYKQSEFQCRFDWKEHGEAKASPKVMAFWFKNFGKA
jgi:GNAT superfamily N-acetyltransferase